MDLTTVLVNGGAAGVVILLYSLGWIAPKPAVDRLEKEADRWRELYEKECEAHDITRRAHTEEIRPALTAGTEAARTAAHLLGSIKQMQTEERP